MSFTVLVGPAVDGRSSFSSGSSLRAFGDSVVVVGLPFGDAPSVDAAIRAAQTDAVLVVVGPYEARSAFAASLGETLDSNDVAIAAPWIFAEDGTLRSAGTGFVQAWAGPYPARAVELFRDVRIDAGAAIERLHVDAFSSPVFALRPATYAGLGGLDLRFDDVRAALMDLTLRATMAGYRNISVAAAQFLERGQPWPALLPADLRRIFELHPNPRMRANDIYAAHGTIFNVSTDGAEQVTKTMPGLDLVLVGDPNVSSHACESAAQLGLSVPPVVHDVRGKDDAVAAIDDLFARRGRRYAAVVDPAVATGDGWLVDALGILASDANAAAARAPGVSLLNLGAFPAHERVTGSSVEEALDDMLRRGAKRLRPTRGSRPLAMTFEPPRKALLPPKLTFIYVVTHDYDTTRFTFDMLLARAIGNVEVFVVHDGTSPILKSHAFAIDVVSGIFDSDPKRIGGINEALAKSTGEIICIVNDSYMLNTGWPEVPSAVLADENVGICVPRINATSGLQAVYDADYSSPLDMRIYAQRRSREHAGKTTTIDASCEMVIAVHRRVVEAIGGFRAVEALSSKTIEEFCIRARSAGYSIVVCEDAFVHRLPRNGKDISPALHVAPIERSARIERGFDPNTDRVPFVRAERTPARFSLLSIYDSTITWGRLQRRIKRALQSFSSESGVAVRLAVADSDAAASLGSKLVRLIERERFDPASLPDVVVEAVDNLAQWRASVDGEAFALEPHAELAGLPTLADTDIASMREAVLHA